MKAISNQVSSRVGLEALAVAVPRRYLAIEDLAVARGVPPAKFTSGLGAREMAVADPGEDTVALAATAASRLLRESDVDPGRIGMVVVGTETGVDHSKAAASYVQGLLGLPKAMRTFDTQHACYGGTAGIMAAADWIASGSARGRAAIVICADIARYGVKTAGEPTQGGGAVAVLVSDTPDLVAFDRGTNGVFATNVHDFWRPLDRREPLVDGHYSIDCYLEAAAGAYRMWRGEAVAAGLVPGEGMASEVLARIAYHVPFCKMAKKAHVHLRKSELEDRGVVLDEAAIAAEEIAAAASFERQVAPGLSLAARIGNTYTASLYFGIASLLHGQAAALAGERIGMFSYGSGCSSEFFSGTVGPNAAAIIARAKLDDVLASRVRIDVAEYERIMALAASEPVAESPASGTFRFTGSDEGRRTYATGA